MQVSAFGKENLSKSTLILKFLSICSFCVPLLLTSVVDKNAKTPSAIALVYISLASRANGKL